MSENTIFINKYNPEDERLAINEREIWRYSGYSGITDSIDAGLREILLQVTNDLKNSLSYRVCHRRMSLAWEDGMPVLPFPSESKKLARCLNGSSEVIIFAATIGLEPDRYIAKYQRISPIRALLAQAYGAERVEALCDAFCDDIKKAVAPEGLSCSGRFSPGYGDLPLTVQTDIFRLLDCNRQIGISLNESLLMVPSKSVTAIFGIGECVGAPNKQKCADCTKLNCDFRIHN